MLLEVTSRWPFVVRRRDLERRHVAPATVSIHGVPPHAHRSWVRVAQGVGWIHHHEADGYVIELQKGGLVKHPTSHLQHIEPPA